jgi:hypothetical protein
MTQPRTIISPLPSPLARFAAGGTLAADYDRLAARAHEAVSDPSAAHARLCALLPDLWALRARALTEEAPSRRDNAEGIEAHYGRLLAQPVGQPLSLLAECVRYALRRLARVSDALGREDVPMLPAGLTGSLPTYAEMSVLMGLLPVGQRLFEFINASMMMELVVGVFDDLLKGRRPMPTDDALHEVCCIINQASHDYGGAARHFGILKKRSKGLHQPDFVGEVDADLLAESRLLAEAGIEEWGLRLLELEQSLS